MIFLLSDGKPTDGYWQTIHSEFEKLNRDVESVVFSFAIGSRSPFDDLEKISLRSGGVARKLEDSTDISVKLSNFYLEIAVPIIWNLQEGFLYFKDSWTTESPWTDRSMYLRTRGRPIGPLSL